MIGPALASVPIDISDLERVDPAVASGLNLDDDMVERAYLHVGVAISFDPVGRISKPSKRLGD
jgi:hypothetical protein